MMNKVAFKRIPVESSNIASIGHSFPRRMLEVEFKNGSIYRYKGVNNRTFKDMLASSSKGKFLNAAIKGIYPYKKYRDSDGTKIKEEYHMQKESHFISDYDEFVKQASYIVQTKVRPPRINLPSEAKYVNKPLTDKQKKMFAALATASGLIAAADVSNRIKEKRQLSKMKKELELNPPPSKQSYEKTAGVASKIPEYFKNMSGSNIRNASSNIRQAEYRLRDEYKHLVPTSEDNINNFTDDIRKWTEAKNKAKSSTAKAHLGTAATLAGAILLTAGAKKAIDHHKAKKQEQENQDK